MTDPKGKIFREDRFPVPLDALREILLNAVMHRDYSDYSGYVAIVVFDDRIEIQSHGLLPDGVTLEQLSGPHQSKLRNPLIAEAFHRTGAVEVWGRGTNRVMAMCEKHGAAPPVFEERQGFLIVTFKAPVAHVMEDRPLSTTQSPTQSPTQSRDPVHRLLNLLQTDEMSSRQLREALEIKHRPTFRKNYLHPAMDAGFIEYTIPDKPNSRLQKYRLTSAGRAALERRGDS
jgi:ATP-dependent DNA helicase RecG